MVQALLPLVLAAGQLAAVPDPPATAIQFRCDFEQGWDENYDTWPDRWTRLRGPDYPAYVPVGLAPCVPPRADGERCLQIGLDGGGAALYSPPIDVTADASYVLEAYVQAEGLEYSTASVSLTFYDAERQHSEELTSNSVQRTDGWMRLRIGPVTPHLQQAQTAVIGLHVQAGKRVDLKGHVAFDDIVLGRLPRILLRTDEPLNLFADPADVEVVCEVSGTSQTDPALEFQLFDASGRELARESVPVTSDRRPPASTSATPVPHRENQRVSVRWRPPVTEYGFYRVQATLHNPDGTPLRRTTTVAALAPLPPAARGEFGWSLPDGERPLELRALPPLLTQAGVSWIKLPVWSGVADTQWAERLAWFADRLSNLGIDLVAVLDRPPSVGPRSVATHELQLAANVFRDPQFWQPVVDPLMMRLSLKVRWWQLGADDDFSFVELPELEQLIVRLKQHWQQYGQKAQLGMAWRWQNELPESKKQPWDFLAFRSDPPLTGEELQTYLTAIEGRPASTWVTLDPLPRDEYDLPTRARDLAERILAAKIARADAIFIPRPFDSRSGLMTEEGYPDELFLVWRTCARLLSGAKYLGQFDLPSGSHNYVFARDGRAILVVWNDQPVTEQLYLGREARQFDLWGRVRPVKDVEEDGREEQRLTVDALPSFITNADLAVAAWRLNFALETKQLSSVFGQAQPVTYRFKNTFPQGVSGRIRITTPETWVADHDDLGFRLAEGEEQVDTFRVQLRSEANSGSGMVIVDFDITADRRYRFRLYRELHVGLDDVTVELTTQLADDGNLLVEQQLTNYSDKSLSFNCVLYAPNRRRMREKIVELGKGSASTTFIVPRGEELIGQRLWLRVEEIGGDRLLNYHITVER